MKALDEVRRAWENSFDNSDGTELTERGKKIAKIKTIDISPEVMQLKPFIMPVKGFSYDEVLGLIQRVVNQAKKS